MSDKILAWHFVADKLKNNMPIPRVGSILRQKGKIIPCKNGLHGSTRIIDALGYAPSNPKWICRTEHRGVVVEHGNDKIASSERKILWKVEAEPILRAFARKCALDVIHLWDAPPVVKKYLKTGNEKLRDAAWDAANAAAWDAAHVARDTACAAACAAASAAKGDADYAARDAAHAVRDTACDAQNTRLTKMIHAARNC